MILQVDDIPIHIERLGSGRQLLLLHGWGPRSVTLEKHLLPTAHSLKHAGEITMMEFPGHGQSGLPTGNWGVREYAELTLKVMDQLAVTQPVLLAHSFGGRIALYLADKYPQRVSALILTGCAGLKSKKTLSGWLRAKLFQAGRMGIKALSLFPGFQATGKRWLASLREAFSSADYLATPEALRGSFSKVVREDLGPLLPHIRQKTLLVWGEKDAATPLAMGRRMAKDMPDARLLVYQADDHFAYRNQPARFANAVEAFLEEVDPA